MAEDPNGWEEPRREAPPLNARPGARRPRRRRDPQDEPTEYELMLAEEAHHEERDYIQIRNAAQRRLGP
jgi:hypothetical protein